MAIPSPLADVPIEIEEDFDCEELHESGWRWQVPESFGFVCLSEKPLSGILLPKETRRLQSRWRVYFGIASKSLAQKFGEARI